MSLIRRCREFPVPFICSERHRRAWWYYHALPSLAWLLLSFLPLVPFRPHLRDCAFPIALRDNWIIRRVNHAPNGLTMILYTVFHSEGIQFWRRQKHNLKLLLLYFLPYLPLIFRNLLQCCSCTTVGVSVKPVLDPELASIAASIGCGIWRSQHFVEALHVRTSALVTDDASRTFRRPGRWRRQN